jgi:hypothetical protein
VLVPQGVVEIRSETSFITFTARSCKEFFTIGLQLKHQGLGVLTRSDVDMRMILKVHPTDLLAFDFAKPTVAQLFVRFLFAFPFSLRTDGVEADATDFPGRGD